MQWRTSSASWLAAKISRMCFIPNLWQIIGPRFRDSLFNCVVPFEGKFHWVQKRKEEESLKNCLSKKHSTLQLECESGIWWLYWNENLSSLNLLLLAHNFLGFFENACASCQFLGCRCITWSLIIKSVFQFLYSLFSIDFYTKITRRSPQKWYIFLMRVCVCVSSLITNFNDNNSTTMRINLL